MHISLSQEEIKNRAVYVPGSDHFDFVSISLSERTLQELLKEEALLSLYGCTGK